MSNPADAAATPRNIPWDCSDWQAAAAVADAEDARVSVILESLATNRGKTLYCAVDQSDTFTKAETWEAGKDRNERDDTVYYGANGRFRGFLAAQEGYLTDGESGVTGISRARIFEFPEEERRKRRRYRIVTEICYPSKASDAAAVICVDGLGSASSAQFIVGGSTGFAQVALAGMPGENDGQRQIPTTGGADADNDNETLNSRIPAVCSRGSLYGTPTVWAEWTAAGGVNGLHKAWKVFRCRVRR